MKKITYSAAIAMAIDALSGTDFNAEALDKLKACKVAFDKKNSAERKPTKTQQENEGLKAAIMEFVATCDTPMLVSDFIKNVPALAGMSPQKVGPLVRGLEAEGRLVCEVIKRRNYYKAA